MRGICLTHHTKQKVSNFMAVDRKSSEYFASHYEKYGKAWYENNKEKQRDTQRKYRERHPERGLWRNARLRAKKVGMEFTITPDDIIIPQGCPVFGEPFETGGMKAASLDRIDNSRGYTPDNIQVISRRANTMKGDSTPEEMKRFADWVTK